MKVEIVSKTTGLGKYDNLTTEEIVSAIARHGVIKEDNGKLVKYLMKNAHWSPLDMINFTFEIETSRAIGRQILRHASIKFQEHSQRYSDRVQFEPIELRREHPTNRQSSTDVIGRVDQQKGSCGVTNEVDNLSLEMSDILSKIETIYNKGISLDVAKESMRFLLPECTTTTMSANGTLRSWLSFLNVRCDSHAQKECVDIANLIGEALEKEMPNVFNQIDWRKGMFL